MSARSLFRLAGCFILVFLIPFISSSFMSAKSDMWYGQLIKSSLTPPDIVFPIIWNILYAMMAVSLWLVIESDTVHQRKTSAYTVFGIQLFFNLNWTFSFFFLQRPLYAIVDLFILIFFVTSTIIMFKKFSKPAAWLIVPYYIWIFFAAFLNLSIIWLN